jgi:hypothetical protein
MMDFEEEEFERIVPTFRHEFGHYVVAREPGFETGEVTIAAPGTIAGPGGGVALTLLFSITNIDELVTYCEKRVQVLMAGVLAEAMENGSFNDGSAKLYMDTTAANDYAKWRELIRLLRNVANPDTTDLKKAAAEVELIHNHLWNVTKEILMKHHESIDKIAKEFARHHVLRSGPQTFTKEELATHPTIRGMFP